MESGAVDMFKGGTNLSSMYHSLYFVGKETNSKNPHVRTYFFQVRLDSCSTSIIGKFRVLGS